MGPILGNDIIESATCMTALIGLYWWQKSFQTGMNHLSWLCLYSLHLLLQKCVFSILANSFSSRQKAALEDYTQLSIILCCSIISEKVTLFFHNCFLRVFVRII